MPYWSSSPRVGVMPSHHHGGNTGKTMKQQHQQSQQNNVNNNHRSNNKSKQRGERFARSKGITMEDLKKQTALRLAQEQSRGGVYGVTSSHSIRNSPYNRSCPTAPTMEPSTISLRNTMAILPPAPQPSMMHNSHRRAYPSPASPPLPEALRSPPLCSTSTTTVREDDTRGDRGPLYERSNAPTRRTPPPGPSVMLSSPSYATPPPSVPRGTQTASCGSPRSSSNNENNQNNSHPSVTMKHNNPNQTSKSILPHGLTVQELKEMTKARLQAEAFSSKNPLPPNPNPYETNSNRATPEPRPSSRASSFASSSPPPPPSASVERVNNHSSKDDRESAPPSEHLQELRFPPTTIRMQASLLSKSSSLSLRSSHLVSSVEPHYGKMNSSFERTISRNGEVSVSDMVVGSSLNATVVGSSLSSSEHPYMNEISSQSSLLMDMASSQSSLPPNRPPAKSEDYGQDSSRWMDSSSSALSSSSNRRRAATMSPRLSGFNRSQDAPLPPVVPTDQLALPSFSLNTPHSTRQLSPFRSEVGIGNRNRTNSATSLPPISHTADEFGLADFHDSNNNNNMSEKSHRGCRAFSHLKDVREEDLPPTSGFWTNHQDKTTITGTMYHETSPPLSPSYGLSQPSDMDTAARLRTWSEPLMGGHDWNISQELQSILKLSGAEDLHHEKTNHSTGQYY